MISKLEVGFPGHWQQGLARRVFCPTKIRGSLVYPLAHAGFPQRWTGEGDESNFLIRKISEQIGFFCGLLKPVVKIGGVQYIHPAHDSHSDHHHGEGSQK